MRHSSLAVLVAALAALPASRALAVEAAVHPFCIQQLVRMGDVHFETEKEQALPIKVCNQHYRKAPIEIKGDYYVAEVKGVYANAFKGAKQTRVPFYKYRIAGYHRNVVVVDLAEGVGDAGVYSAIALVTGWPVTESQSKDSRDMGGDLDLVGVLERGDRCNGGIASAKMSGNATLELGEKITPYDLFVYRAVRALRRDKNAVAYHQVENETIEPISPKLMELEPYRDLDTAATSCIGTAATEYDLDSGTSKLVSITLTGLVDKDPKWVAKHKHQACFNKVVKAAVPSFPKTLEPDEISALSKTFESQCLGDKS